jgi:4-hydroxy-3-polyprenylbenzoate decarboxylase
VDYNRYPVPVSIKFMFFVLQSEQNDDLPPGGHLKIVVAVTGASGAIYALRLLERLHRPGPDAGIEVHLILSRSGEKTLFLETGKHAADIKSLASFYWPVEDISAPLASGSFQTDGMVISPCSIHTMSAIAHGITSSLITRTADVMLKEHRRLILMVRESPFHLGHLRTMTQLAEMGAIVAPPVPGFYNNPQTIEDLVDSSIDRVFDLLGVPDEKVRRWSGPKTGKSPAMKTPGDKHPENKS